MVCFSLLGTLRTALVLGAPLPWPFCWQTPFWTPLRVKLSPLLGFFQAVLPHPRPETLPLWCPGSLPCLRCAALLALSSGPISEVGLITIPFPSLKREVGTELIHG